MKLLIQENILKREPRYQQLISALNFFEMDYTLVNLFSFVDKIYSNDVTSLQLETSEEIEIDTKIPTLTFGSQKLSRLATERGLSPAAFNSDNFDFEKWSKGFGLSNILNYDTQLVKIKDLDIIDSKMFIRPLKDDKSFNGMLLNAESLTRWKSEVIEHQEKEGAYLNENTIISVASPKTIYSEHRFFAIGRDPVTCSTYRKMGATIYDEKVEQHILAVAMSMCRGWQPERAYVIDIADTPDGPKVIEINSFGVSGFYHCDMFKLIDGIKRSEDILLNPYKLDSRNTLEAGRYKI